MDTWVETCRTPCPELRQLHSAPQLAAAVIIIIMSLPFARAGCGGLTAQHGDAGGRRALWRGSARSGPRIPQRRVSVVTAAPQRTRGGWEAVSRAVAAIRSSLTVSGPRVRDSVSELRGSTWKPALGPARCVTSNESRALGASHPCPGGKERPLPEV